MIQVNGKHEIAWEEGLTVSKLLERMGYTYHQIVVTVNGDLVRRGSYDSFTIPDGADVKVIHLIAGG
jgi:sulfur carrier protein